MRPMNEKENARETGNSFYMVFSTEVSFLNQHVVNKFRGPRDGNEQNVMIIRPEIQHAMRTFSNSNLQSLQAGHI